MNELDMFGEDDAEPMDAPARNALLQSVLFVGSRVRGRHGVELFMRSAQDPFNAASASQCIPWKLVEILCALTVLDQAESVTTKRIFHLRGKVPAPVEFVRTGRPHFLWIQHSMEGELSGYEWRPDLIVTDNGFKPTAENVTEIIECKHRRNLDSVTVRSEFAKSYDLKVESYLIWSYFDVSPKVNLGAERFGLEIKPIGLGRQDRGHFLDPVLLANHISEGIREARDRRRFADRLTEAANEVHEKAARDGRLR